MDDERRNRSDPGFSMVVTVISLLVTALLVLLALTTMFKSSGNGSTKLSNQPGVGTADDLSAQQALQTTLTTADAVAAGSGGYGSVTASALAASDPSISYVAGPSASSATISVAASTGSAGGAGGGMTLAVRSATGNCWLVWKGDGGATWFGQQTGLTSCTAPPLGTAPTATPVSSTSIGWRQGAFPT